MPLSSRPSSSRLQQGGAGGGQDEFSGVLPGAGPASGVQRGRADDLEGLDELETCLVEQGPSGGTRPPAANTAALAGVAPLAAKTKELRERAEQAKAESLGQPTLVKEQRPHSSQELRRGVRAVEALNKIHSALDEEERHIHDEIERVKIASLHQMVDHIKCDVHEAEVEVSCLYLSNDRASKVPMTSMHRVREQLGMREPKMVIRLMPSQFGVAYNKTFPWYTAGEHGGRYPTKRSPELSDEDEEYTEHRLLLFARDVLLPLATRTQALVIGSESCSLTAAFVVVSAPFQRQLGADCPFRLLIFARAYYFHLSSMEPGTVAHAIRNRCRAWKEASGYNECLEGAYGEDRTYWPRDDLASGKYSLILFECQEPKGKVAVETSHNFSNDFISSLSQQLPVIALQTYGTNKMSMVPALAQHVSRGLPLMLLDSRDRKAESLESCKEQMNYFAGRLHGREQPRLDQYFASALAFLKSSVDQSLKSGVSQCPGNRSAGDSSKAVPDSQLWLWEALEKREHSEQERSGAGGRRNSGVSRKDEPSETAILADATGFIMKYVGGELEWESKVLQERCEEGIDAVMAAKTWQEFSASLSKNWVKIRGCCFHTFEVAREFAVRNPWLTLHEKDKASAEGSKILVIETGLQDFDYTSPEIFQKAKHDLGSILKQALAISRAYDRAEKSREAFSSDQDMWLAVYEILKAKNVHTGNIHDLTDVSDNLFRLAQIDRLPQNNTLEGLHLLRDAWTIVDYYNHCAHTYKWYAKLSYFVLLTMGVFVVGFTAICATNPDMVSARQRSTILLVASLVTSFICGYTAIVDPHRKWVQLRNGAYLLEAEIWKFRARVAQYKGSSNVSHGRILDERRAESKLQQVILQVQGRALLSTGLKETSFYSMPVFTYDLRKGARPLVPDDGGSCAIPVKEEGSKPRSQTKLSSVHVKHCQHPGNMHVGKRPLPSQDSFHAPASPEDYIRWRLVPKMKFYKDRIPRYAFRRRLFQALILAAALTTSLFAAINQTNWTAVVATISSAVAGWQEFTDIAKKLRRYSGTADDLANLLVWWQSLSTVDKALVGNVSHLVEKTEELLSGERNAWMSDEATPLQPGAAKDGKESGKVER